MREPLVRKRVKKPKTRTGCFSCKARHIKCDEEKPHCRRCTSSGRTCQGYPDLEAKQAAVVRKQILLRPRLSMMETFIINPESHNLSVPERRAIDFFRHQNSHNFMGSFWPLSAHQTLFETTMRICSHESAAAYACAALGSIHQARWFFPDPSLAKDCENFAERQSAKAMAELRRYISNISGEYSDDQAEVILLISLLFFRFELWRSRDHAARIHLRSGMKIIHERCRNREITDESSGKHKVMLDAESHSSLSLLLRIFVRLDGDPVVSKGEPYLLPIIQEPLPASFLSIEEATTHLDALSALISAVSEDLIGLARADLERVSQVQYLEAGMHTCLAGTLARTISFRAMPELAVRIQQSRLVLHRWLNASAYMPFDPDQEQAHVLARIQFFTLWYEMLSWREPDEMFTDDLQEQFVYILDQCARYISIQHADNSCNSLQSARLPNESVSPIFSLGTGLVTCLCGVAFKCRSSSVRRRCIELLASFDLQGVFDNDYLTAFVRAVVDVEEKRARHLTGIDNNEDLLSFQIPAEARLLDVDIDRELMARDPEFYKRNVGSLIYAVHGSNGEVEIHRQSFKVRREAEFNKTDSRCSHQLYSPVQLDFCQGAL